MKENQKLSFKEAAIQILKSENEPLSAKEIVDIAFQKGLLSTEGKTPEATMAAQIYVDIDRNKKTKFKKIGRGKLTRTDAPAAFPVIFTLLGPTAGPSSYCFSHMMRWFFTGWSGFS